MTVADQLFSAFGRAVGLLERYNFPGLLGIVADAGGIQFRVIYDVRLNAVIVPERDERGGLYTVMDIVAVFGVLGTAQITVIDPRQPPAVRAVATVDITHDRTAGSGDRGTDRNTTPP